MLHAANTPGTHWDGGSGSTANWSDGDNWNGTGGSPQIPTNAAVLTMGGSLRLTNVVDAGAMVNLAGFKFTNDVAASFVIRGNTLTNGSRGIFNMRSGLQTISNRIELSAAQVWTNSAGLVLFEGVVTNQGNQITINGVGGFRFDGSFDGSGSIVIDASSTNYFNAAAGYTGDLTNSGTAVVVVSANNALGGTGGKTVIQSGAELAFSNAVNYSSAENIEINGSGVNGNGAIDSISGTNTFAGAIKLNGNSTIGLETNQFTLSGTITNNSNLLTFTNADLSTIIISGNIGGTGGLVHNGLGTLSLTSSNSFSGNVTNTLGAMEVSHASALGTSSSFVVSGGTLLYKTGFTNTAASVVLSGGTIRENDQNVSLGAMTLTANSIVQLGSGGASATLRFVSGTNTVGSGATLTIYGWSWNSALSGGSDDLIFFTNTAFETASFLNNVTFFGTGGGARVLSTGELVPITPEPSTWAAGLIVFGAVTLHLLTHLRSRFV